MTTTPDGPTLTHQADADFSDPPCPRIDVVVSNMPADAEQITVFRVWGDSNRAVVRGANKATVSGDFSITDYEWPYAVNTSYECQTFDSAGTPSLVSTSTLALAGTTITGCWLQDPLDPSSAVFLAMQHVSTDQPAMGYGSLTSAVTYASSGSVIPVPGMSLPVAFTQPHMAGKAAFMARARDRTSGDNLRALLSGAGPLALRVTDLLHPWPPLTYVHVGDVVEEYLPKPVERSTFTVTFTQVRGPSLTVVIPVRTYADVSAEAASYAGLAGLYATYLDLRRGVQV